MTALPPRKFLLASAFACLLCAFVISWALGQYAKGASSVETLLLPLLFVLLVSGLPYTLVPGRLRAFYQSAVLIYAAALALIVVVAQI